MKKYIYTVILLIFSLNLLQAAWLVKINNNEIVITTKEFLSIVDTTVGRDNLSSEEVVDELIDSYINQKLLLREAKKSGYHKGHADIKAKYKETKDLIMMQKYMEEKIPFNQEKLLADFKANFKEDDAKEYYKKYKEAVGAPQSYGSLSLRDKQQIQQTMLMEKAQKEQEKLKKAYIKSVNSKYKKKNKKELVKRYDISKLIIARVGDTEITKSELERTLVEQLSMMNINKAQIDQLKKENVAEYNKYLSTVLDDLILQKVLAYQMKKDDFTTSSKAKLISEQLYESLIVEQYKEELLAKNRVTDEEINQAYEENKEYFKNETNHEKIFKVLKTRLEEEKVAKILKKRIQKIRDKSVIQKNEAELKKIK